MTCWLTPSQISGIFAEEIVTARGSVAGTFEDGDRLFARSVLSPSIEVAPGDRLQGGVALRATDADIFVHPYVYRLVCTNGAIMARATQTSHISRENWFIEASIEATGDLETTIRDAIRRCCAPEAFVMAANQMRSARETAADMAITLAGFMANHNRALPWALLVEILQRYDQASDRSAYGLMNAVTSVARDTRDPEMKWRLEEIGGGVPMMRCRPMPGPRRAVLRTPVAVG